MLPRHSSGAGGWGEDNDSDHRVGSEHRLSSGMVMWMVDLVLNGEMHREGLQPGSVGPSSCCQEAACGQAEQGWAPEGAGRCGVDQG